MCFDYIVKANICKPNKKYLWESLLMLRKRFFPNIITIDVKPFDTHMPAILITVLKKKCVGIFIDFSFCDFRGHKKHFSFCFL